MFFEITTGISNEPGTSIIFIFALSFNLAKYGMKYQGICPEDWQRPFLIHVGTGDKPKSLRIARQTLEEWSRL